ELAVWYANLELFDEGKEVLELAPQNTETLYWLAWLSRDLDASLSKEYLEKAAASSPAFVFPFREETAKVLEWAADKDASWHSDYLLALIEDYRGNRKDALERMNSYDDHIDFAPFYMLRARLHDQSSLPLKLQDVDKAISIDQEEWRYGRIKSGILVQMDKQEEALQVLKDYYKADKDNYIVGLDLVRVLIRSKEYEDAEKTLSTLHV